MSNERFILLCKDYVKNYTLHLLDKNETIPPFEVFVVWSCKTLQHHKALLSTTYNDGMYYECTYNGDTQELYCDVYKKVENQTFKC